MTNNTLRSTILTLFTLTLFACASQPQKPREPYAGADSVETVTPQMLVGNWQVRMLNATDGELESWNTTEMRSVANFRNDGTLVMVTSSAPMGLEIQTDGTWRISGSLVTTAATSSKNLSNNPLSALTAGFLTSFKDKMAGTANVYEATDSRLVLVNEQEGVALEYTRIQ